tara:strand:+ start:40 stop:444 length:405 start_codon:yes stop_codon:yes gene_type:complete
MVIELTLVEEFNKAFKIWDTGTEPCLIPKKEYLLRHELTKEENDEYLEACKNNDLVEVADALGDELYILCGKILRHNMAYKILDVFEEIHRSNMSKLDENGDPIFRNDGKVLKGKKYFKPNIKKILDEYKKENS